MLRLSKKVRGEILQIRKETFFLWLWQCCLLRKNSISIPQSAVSVKHLASIHTFYTNCCKYFRRTWTVSCYWNFIHIKLSAEYLYEIKILTYSGVRKLQKKKYFNLSVASHSEVVEDCWIAFYSRYYRNTYLPDEWAYLVSKHFDRNEIVAEKEEVQCCYMVLPVPIEF